MGGGGGGDDSVFKFDGLERRGDEVRRGWGTCTNIPFDDGSSGEIQRGTKSNEKETTYLLLYAKC